MKIAILHEMLIKLGGAEKVVEALCNTFPDADLFTLIYDEKKVEKVFPKEKIKKVASLTQKVYSFTKKQRLCLPFMPYAVESLDFSEYDVVIVSSSGFAHGLITKPETKVIVYYHSPARYLWDWTNEYKRDIGWNSGIKGYLLNRMFLKLREWDYIASKRGDILLANSNNVKERIQKYYRRDVEVVYPPIEVSRFEKMVTGDYGIKKLGDYCVIISALTEFKKIEIAINHFPTHAKEKLVIIGEGNYRKNLEDLAREKNNILFVGAKYGDELVAYVQGSKGLIFPGEEDFGIVPIEALAAGKPVFAYFGGGLKETIQKGVTGGFFYQHNGGDFSDEYLNFIQQVKDNIYITGTLKNEANKYNLEVFKSQILKMIK